MGLRRIFYTVFKQLIKFRKCQPLLEYNWYWSGLILNARLLQNKFILHLIHFHVALHFSTSYSLSLQVEMVAFILLGDYHFSQLGQKQWEFVSALCYNLNLAFLGPDPCILCLSFSSGLRIPFHTHTYMLVYGWFIVLFHSNIQNDDYTTNKSSEF